MKIYIRKKVIILSLYYQPFNTVYQNSLKRLYVIT